MSTHKEQNIQPRVVAWDELAEAKARIVELERENKVLFSDRHDIMQKADKDETALRARIVALERSRDYQKDNANKARNARNRNAVGVTFWKERAEGLERIIADAQAAPDAVGAASRAFMKDVGGNHMAAALTAANLHSVARVAELEAALKEIASEQSAKSATDAADRFQAIARAALQPKAKTEL